MCQKIEILHESIGALAFLENVVIRAKAVTYLYVSIIFPMEFDEN